MTGDEDDIRDIITPAYMLPPPPFDLQPGIAYVYWWEDGSWVAIGEADPPEPVYPRRDINWGGQTEQTITVTFDFNEYPPPRGEALAALYGGGTLSSRPPATYLEETADGDIAERIDGALDGWDHWRDAAHWRPGLLLATCFDCGDGTLAIPFGDEGARAEWVSAHVAATGHNVRLSDEDDDAPPRNAQNAQSRAVAARALAEWRRARGDDDGISTVESGLIVAAIAIVVAAVVFGLGLVVSSAFDKGCTAADSQSTTCPSPPRP